MNLLRRHLLHAVDKVLAGTEVTEHQRLEALSLKKMLKGNGSWEPRKVLLGWVIDLVRQTLELPPHRKSELASIFKSLCSARRVSHKRFERILGKLRFVSVAIPGSAGIFSALQLALNKAQDGQIKVTKSLKDHIFAFA